MKQPDRLVVVKCLDHPFSAAKMVSFLEGYVANTSSFQAVSWQEVPRPTPKKVRPVAARVLLMEEILHQLTW